MANLPYNLTCFTNARDFVQVMVCNNGVTNNLFGASILLIVFAISFISMLGFGQKNALVASLWLTTLVSTFLSTMTSGLINPDIMVLLTIISALSTLLLFRTREN